MTRRTCRRLAAVTLVIGILVIAWAGRAFVAEFLMIGPRELVSDWSAGTERPAAEDLDKVIALVETATALKPGDAGLHLELGRLHKLRALALGYGTETRTAALQRAATEFHTAMQLRPSWGAAWAAYAQVQYLLGRNGRGSIEAFRQAMQLAPHEGDSYRLLAWLGFAHWPQLPAEDRQAFRALLNDYSSPAYIPPLLEYAVHFHREALVEPLVRADPKLDAALQVLLRKRQEAVARRAH